MEGVWIYMSEFPKLSPEASVLLTRACLQNCDFYVVIVGDYDESEDLVDYKHCIFASEKILKFSNEDIICLFRQSLEIVDEDISNNVENI